MMSSFPPTLPPSVCVFYQYQAATDAAAANRLLFNWLSDDKLRAELYADMIATQSPLHFTSNATQRDNNDSGDKRDFDWPEGPRDYQQPAVLLVHPEHIAPALHQSNTIPIGATPDQVRAGLQYSSTAYRGLGGFSMLGMDDPAKHDAQRAFALAALQAPAIGPQQYDALATLAFKTGALGYLKSHEFDLAAMAENIAVRYVCMTFGFAPKDLALIEASARKVGRGIEYQNIGRHFVFEPATMQESRQAIVQLGQRATEIMGLYVKDAVLGRLESDEKAELDSELERVKKTKFKHHNNTYGDQQTLKEFAPITQWMVSDDAKATGKTFSLVDKGLIAAGLVGGAVANIQNAICIVMAQWMTKDAKGEEGRAALKNAAIDLRGKNPDGFLNEGNLLHDRIKEAMRVNPPAAFIPRRANNDIQLTKLPILDCVHDHVPDHHYMVRKDTLVLIGMGGASWRPVPVNVTSTAKNLQHSNRFANEVNHSTLKGATNPTNSASNSGCPFSKGFGGSPLTIAKGQPQRWEYTHSCPGMMMSMHLIDYAMRQLILLPSLSEVLNTKTREPYGLEKRWGVHAVSYRMRYQREKWLVQTPLQTVLPIRAPIDKYSQELRQVIRLGAPLIEKVIRDANHVHFASFMFIENDSKLVLFTMYDGDFDSYIGHFAREFSYLFDRFFSCMAVQPPMPIREHTDEFVEYLKQFARPPVEGYYFSAYPRVSTAQIVNAFARPGELDWQTER